MSQAEPMSGGALMPTALDKGQRVRGVGSVRSPHRQSGSDVSPSPSTGSFSIPVPSARIT